MINEFLSVPWDGLDQHVRMISCLSRILDGRDVSRKSAVDLKSQP